MLPQLASATVRRAGIIGPGNFWFGREMELNRIGMARTLHRFLILQEPAAWIRPSGMPDA
jgi:hypothetical protein